MNIYLLQQSSNNKFNFFDECVIVANNVEEAKQLSLKLDDQFVSFNNWVTDVNLIEVILIGKATNAFTEPTFISVSFNE